MRRLAPIPTILALLIASVMAPYQHVHVRLSGPHSSAAQQDDDDDSAVVHVHFVIVSALSQSARHGLAAPGDDHIARALDIFTLLLHPIFQLSVLPVWHALLVRLAPLHEQVAETVEACGHDPPDLTVSIPRAPPA